MKVALCGNPNVGKTTLYNRLTRSDAPTGNWHGVTVDSVKKRIAGTDITLVDLPGTYSLTARSKEEETTRDEVLFGGYDAVVCVAEVNNLRRNLYLFAQLGECRRKVVLVVNMLDEAKGKVDLPLLAARLGVPVVGTSERMKSPKEELLRALQSASAPKLDYLCEFDAVKPLVNSDKCAALDPRFAAIKLCERDAYISDVTGIKLSSCAECGACEKLDLPAMRRYAYIDKIISGVVEKRADKRTEKLDGITLGKFALPVLFAVLALVFVITFEGGKPLSRLLQTGVDAAVSAVDNSGLQAVWRSLFGDGIISSVGSVLAFLPQVCILFVLTALLQDSGYMSRVAFLSDGFFKRLGLSGRAAFSLVLGLGCSVTGILSSRGSANGRARKRTAFVIPFVPCSARLAVFTALSAYFGLSGLVTFALYMLGVFAAFAALCVMRLFGKGEKSDELLMEMPPFRLPSARRVTMTVLGNVWAFIKRVGTVVLAVGLAMWALNNFAIGAGFTGDAENSIMSVTSNFLAPIFSPLGFGNAKAVSALISGIAAKETVISAIASLGGADAVFGSTAGAVSFMIFTCLYIPCVATVAALGKEAGAGYAAASVAVHMLVAYICSFLYYGSTQWIETNVPLFAAVWSVIAALLLAAVLYATIKSVRQKKKSVVR